MKNFFSKPARDVFACIEQFASYKRPMAAMIVTIASMAVVWWVYVPVHELLHAFGCWATGGEVFELQIAPQYGGAIFAKLFPFVVSGGEYAGRLSGWDHHGSDFIYLVTDFMPFMLTVLIGVPLLAICAGRPRPILLGPAIVMGLASFINLTGDFFEMGTVITTTIVGSFSSENFAKALVKLRSDDLFLSISQIWRGEAKIGIGEAMNRTDASAMAFVSMVLGLLLAFATYWIGLFIARFGWGVSTLRSPPSGKRPT